MVFGETTRLEARTLGTSDLAIPPIGMVAWAIGGSGMAVWPRNTTTTRPQRFLQHSTVV